ncbi:hypothetical protein [Hymenobacter mucosus]|uniref:Uncharacterized protein n=1 Tax=Hymenobacter mucosus TaxID=1411120 RepID=A0A238VFA2_9BACT|nr:hypothetical protein [Hymenobacter mucosus]SNR32848.1 hypothetical protein SAMN06269173_101559 [Hymenobacter mucosus]
MKISLVSSLLLLGLWGGLTKIHDRNLAIQQAGQAYFHHDFTSAAQAYKEATFELGASAEAVWLNLAHATAQDGRPQEARAYYGRLLSSKTPAVRSTAAQQLAVLAAGQGDYAQALALLRQALLAAPANADARYNYEVLHDFLTRRAADPHMPPPGTDGNPTEPTKGPSERNPTRQPQAQPGTMQQGQLNDPTQPQNPQNASESRENSNGQRDPNRPSTTPGNSAAGSFQPGKGEQRNVAQGSQPGSVQGLSNEETGPEATGGVSRRAGTEQAAADEAQVQTQRARLQQMNLSSGQARQLLEALGAAEQQYLQQLPHQPTRKAEKGKPGW